MSSPSSHHRKSSDAVSAEKNKFPTKHNEIKNGTNNRLEVREHMVAVKKSNIPVGMNVHRKSDAEKSMYAYMQEKASEEQSAHESKEFAGVTLIFRTPTNPKPSASVDTHGKTGVPDVRRKSELPQTQFNMQDKYQYKNKTDHRKTSYPIFTMKSNSSLNSFDNISSSNNQH